ncbi:hypothetical protein Pmani_040215 [Petrolisthes manimaculis]|uniref:Uncharacterized protein n=1 Tax=Petrolisthes manimaculis TaxID=1843537 RepID=A0AAE1NB06_9EUCA|nr:hypothetical protein Pmani_040215 [Petrolisthes manimaculis]
MSGEEDFPQSLGEEVVESPGLPRDEAEDHVAFLELITRVLVPEGAEQNDQLLQLPTHTLLTVLKLVTVGPNLDQYSGHFTVGAPHLNMVPPLTLLLGCVYASFPLHTVLTSLCDSLQVQLRIEGTQRQLLHVALAELLLLLLLNEKMVEYLVVRLEQ